MPRSVSTLALLATLVGFPGCGKENGEPAATAPFAGKEVALHAPAGLDAESTWPRLLDEWTARTGGGFRIAPYAVEPPGAALDAVRGSSASGASALVFFPLTRLPELAAAGVLAPIPLEQKQPARLAWGDVLPGLRESLGQGRQQPCALPVAAPVLVLYYRRDLLEKAGLAPPETWDEYAALVESIEDWAPGLTAVEPWGPGWRTTMFLARAVSYCRHPENYSVFFDVNDARPLINSPGFVRALDEARNTRIRLAPESLSLSPADCRREFFDGRAALAIAFETGPGNPPLFAFGAAAAGEAPAASAVGGRPPEMRAGFAPLPGVREIYYHTARGGRWEEAPSGAAYRVALVGFAGMGVAAVDPAPDEAAWSLLRTLTIDEAASAFPGGARSPCRESQLARPAQWVGTELVGDEPAGYLAAVERSLRAETAVADLPIVERDRFRNALAIGIDAAITGQARSAGALGAVAKRWGEMLLEDDPRRVLDSYRRSLGLRPTTAPTAPPR